MEDSRRKGKFWPLYSLIAGMVLLRLCGPGPDMTRQNTVSTPQQSDEERYKAKVGFYACNATNGVYVGRIVDAHLDRVNDSGLWVYEIERQGSDRYVILPVNNTNATPTPCANY